MNALPVLLLALVHPIALHEHAPDIGDCALPDRNGSTLFSITQTCTVHEVTEPISGHDHISQETYQPCLPSLDFFLSGSELETGEVYAMIMQRDASHDRYNKWTVFHLDEVEDGRSLMFFRPLQLAVDNAITLDSCHVVNDSFSLKCYHFTMNILFIYTFDAHGHSYMQANNNSTNMPPHQCSSVVYSYFQSGESYFVCNTESRDIFTIASESDIKKQLYHKLQKLNLPSASYVEYMDNRNIIYASCRNNSRSSCIHFHAYRKTGYTPQFTCIYKSGYPSDWISVYRQRTQATQPTAASRVTKPAIPQTYFYDSTMPVAIFGLAAFIFLNLYICCLFVPQEDDSDDDEFVLTQQERIFFDNPPPRKPMQQIVEQQLK